MTLVTTKQLLAKATKQHYAVGAFNVNNLEILQAIIWAAEKQCSPVIVQTSEGAIKYAGLEELHAMIRTLAERSSIPMALHLDHGKDLELIKKCIRIGYTSVMIDGSKLPLEQNAVVTKKVVSWAHKKGVSVEAELGTIGGAEDLVSSRNIILADPEVVHEFVQKTGCDSLAVAIGTSHGAYKFSGNPHLDLKRLQQIRKKTSIPLVLHGASSVPEWLLRTAVQYGAFFPPAKGVPEEQLKQAIKLGIAKINTDTDLRLACDAGIRQFLSQKPEDFDPRHILGAARTVMQRVVEHRMSLFGSSGKAGVKA